MFLGTHFPKWLLPSNYIFSCKFDGTTVRVCRAQAAAKDAAELRPGEDRDDGGLGPGGAGAALRQGERGAAQGERRAVRGQGPAGQGPGDGVQRERATAEEAGGGQLVSVRLLLPTDGPLIDRTSTFRLL